MTTQSGKSTPMNSYESFHELLTAARKLHRGLTEYSATKETNIADLIEVIDPNPTAPPKAWYERLVDPIYTARPTKTILAWMVYETPLRGRNAKFYLDCATDDVYAAWGFITPQPVLLNHVDIELLSPGERNELLTAFSEDTNGLLHKLGQMH